MRMVRDSSVDTQTTKSTQTLPNQTTWNTAPIPGSVVFDNQTNLFYGRANNSVAPIGSRVASTFNVGITPAGMALTPDNKYLFVANNNDYTIAGQDSVTVVDLEAGLPLGTIYDVSFDGPYTINIIPQLTVDGVGTSIPETGYYAYVTNSVGTTITIIDVATVSVVGVITGLNGPSGMVTNVLTAYVNNYGAGETSGTGTTVSIVDLLSNTVTGSITVGLAPAALAISPDGMYVYCANYVTGNPGTGTISIIQTSSNTVVSTITGFFGPFSIAVSNDGRTAYVTNFGSNNFTPFGNSVSVVDLATETITANIVVGIQPSGLALTPDGLYAYISNYNTLYAGADYSALTAGQGTVNVINLATNQVIAPTIDVGQSPANVVISSDGKYAYVSNYTSNTVTAITV